MTLRSILTDFIESLALLAFFASIICLCAALTSDPTPVAATHAGHSHHKIMLAKLEP